MFDWRRFLRQQRIPFVESGPNWAPGNVNVHCPFCGAADPSEHMGIHLHGKGWACRRNSTHSGKSRARLIQAMLHCTAAEANLLAYGDEGLAPTRDEDLMTQLRASLDITPPTAPAPIELPRTFKPLLNGSRFATPFIRYLEGRGYRGRQLEWLADKYELHYATKGPFAWRVIMPIRDRKGTLLTWTGRTIKPDVQPRYKTLRVNPPEDDDYDQPIAVAPIGECLIGLPLLWSCDNPRALVICEGPFDGPHLSLYGHPWGVYGTCMFGLNISDAQVGLLQELASRFETLWLLVDADAELQRLRLYQELAVVGCRAARMPPGVKDPGSMSGADATALCQQLLD